MFKLWIMLVLLYCALFCESLRIKRDVNECGTSGFDNGDKKLKRGEHPWMVALYKVEEGQPPQYFCAGVLVSRTKIVTAAHCVWGKNQLQMLPCDVIIKLGAFDLDNNFELNTFITTPAKIIVHSDWNSTSETFNDDIAVLLLKEEVPNINFIRPVCVADLPVIQSATEGIAAGWDKSESILRKAQLSITANEDCYRGTTEYADLPIFCANSSESRGFGDSGNGFFIFHNGRTYLKGIGSITMKHPASRTCDATQHSLFTDVLEFIDWIEDPTGEAPKCGVMTRSAGLVQGGSFSTREQFPWQVSILKSVNEEFIHRGSGSLITMKHILAEASAVSDHEEETEKIIALDKHRIKLFLGTLKFDEATTFGSIEVNGDGIAEILVHPNALDGRPSVADIAIISLKNRLHRSKFISPVCLWTGNDADDSIGLTAYGVGYGRDESGQISGIRKHAKMFIISDSECNSFWRQFKTSTNQSEYFCALGTETESACGRDHSLYVKRNGFWFIRGLLSLVVAINDGVCVLGQPLLYESVAFYRNWIAANSNL